MVGHQSGHPIGAGSVPKFSATSLQYNRGRLSLSGLLLADGMM